MASDDILLMAHLMRRAGFGASYEELKRRAAVGYEATVEELLHPEEQPDLEMDVMHRYMHGWRDMHGILANQGYWTYRMVNSPRQLEEKICLLWHCIFPVGDAKCMKPKQIQIELDNFRANGLGKFSKLLLGLATDPAMIYYLDNQLSHKEAVNENWGRELLELFSMGVGMDGSANYTEEDVQACARAFTGWTIANAIPRYPYGNYDSQFLSTQAASIADLPDVFLPHSTDGDPLGIGPEVVGAANHVPQVAFTKGQRHRVFEPGPSFLASSYGVAIAKRCTLNPCSHIYLTRLPKRKS